MFKHHKFQAKCPELPGVQSYPRLPYTKIPVDPKRVLPSSSVFDWKSNTSKKYKNGNAKEKRTLK